MTKRPYWQQSASELASSMSNGSTNAQDVVADVVGRMRSKNDHLNAVVDDLGDEALRIAQEHDRHFRQSGPIGPLHGVPVTIKENVDQEGHATPNGVAAFKDIIAPDDAPVVRNLKEAGAIIIGRTNTPEFSFRATTDNELHGQTLNPWNDWASPGGSSGGASAAVMSGMGALAHGNDIGGSLRFPAAATGATTVKPGLGRVPAYNPSAGTERGILAQQMSVQGVIAREVKDVRLGLETLIGFDARDPFMVPLPLSNPLAETSQQGSREIAFTKNTYEFDLHPAVDQALDTARDALVDAGYQITEIDVPLLRETARDGYSCLLGETKTLMGSDIRKYGSDTVNRIFDHYFEYFTAFEGDDLLLGLARRTHYARQWALFMQKYPLILTPFLPRPTYAHNRDAEGMEGMIEVLGAGLYSYAVNFVGLPSGVISANSNFGLPVGVQIIGRRFSEDTILDACEAVEQRVGIMADLLFAREGEREG